MHVKIPSVPIMQKHLNICLLAQIVEVHAVPTLAVKHVERMGKKLLRRRNLNKFARGCPRNASILASRGKELESRMLAFRGQPLCSTQ